MKYVYLTIISILSIIILWININLHSENYTKLKQKEDILKQLNFLENQLKNLGDKMQRLYPEGFVFINVLYGLSWCELAISDKNDLLLKEKAVKEAIFAYDEINSEKGKWTFDSTLQPEYGIFYCGWRNYLLSKILTVDTSFNQNRYYLGLFQNQCDSIAVALKMARTPYLESYYRQSWPADMFVGMASLSNHDKLFTPKYQEDVDKWLQNVKGNLASKTSMIPHKADSKTGKAIEGSRGSSMGVILRMLSEISPEFGKEQFKLYKANFISTTLGLPSVREFPIGVCRSGDIDSGPVVFGVGFSATIMSIGTLSAYNDLSLADNQYRTIHAFGFPIKYNNQKMYLLGEIPVADAFIVWGKATNVSINKENNCKSKLWNIRFHMISFTLIIVLWLIFLKNWIAKRLKFKKNIA